MAPTPIDPLRGPKYILDGRIVTMNEGFDVIDRGRVYIDAGKIVAVEDLENDRITVVAGEAAARPEGFRGAPLIRTGGTIYPGLIELHNHLILQSGQVARPR